MKVILFGSRVHDTEKGGDIDILIESTEPAAMILKRKLPFLVTLKQKIGDSVEKAINNLLIVKG